MSEEQLSDYSWQMNLTVKSLKKGDFGGYVCSTVNALGSADGCVRLQGTSIRSIDILWQFYRYIICLVNIIPQGTFPRVRFFEGKTIRSTLLLLYFFCFVLFRSEIINKLIVDSIEKKNVNFLNGFRLISLDLRI